jgi:hypothetical protein
LNDTVRYDDSSIFHQADIVRPVDGMGTIEEIFGRIAATLASA